VVNNDKEELPDISLEHSDGEDGKYLETGSSSSDSKSEDHDPDQRPQSSDILLFLSPARVPSSTTPNKRHLRRTPQRPLSPTAVLPKPRIRRMRAALPSRRKRLATRALPRPSFPTDPPAPKLLLPPTMSSAYKPTTTSDRREKATIRVKFPDPPSYLSEQTPQPINTAGQRSESMSKPSNAPASKWNREIMNNQTPGPFALNARKQRPGGPGIESLTPPPKLAAKPAQAARLLKKSLPTADLPNKTSQGAIQLLGQRGTPVTFGTALNQPSPSLAEQTQKKRWPHRNPQAPMMLSLKPVNTAVFSQMSRRRSLPYP
jgi:hypothetical protein